jgi:hypothetical protein
VLCLCDAVLCFAVLCVQDKGIHDGRRAQQEESVPLLPRLSQTSTPQQQQQVQSPTQDPKPAPSSVTMETNIGAPLNPMPSPISPPPALSLSTSNSESPSLIDRDSQASKRTITPPSHRDFRSLKNPLPSIETEILPSFGTTIAVKLRLSELHTSDGRVSHVEFPFNVESDNFEVRLYGPTHEYMRMFHSMIYC